jgi:phenylacetic acid degradation protein paaN
VSAEAWFTRHEERLRAAVRANRTREGFTPFVDSPSARLHPEGAHAAGRAAADAHLGRPFELGLPGVVGRLGSERSPYTGEPLGVTYESVDVDALFAAVGEAWGPWRRASVRARVGVCAEILDRWAQAVFENAYATQHTTGQAFMLAFAGSGASSLDRGLEALAVALDAMEAIPGQATYTRAFGRDAEVTLEKRYRLAPVGVAVVLSCGSYPAWNAYPAILANLATGNPVVLKPHPDTILPMAIAARIGRAALADAGFDPNLLTLAVDTWTAPIAKALFARPETRIVDFTGGQAFGRWIETSLPGVQTYTETAGCNAVVLESAADLDAALGAIALGLVLFSAQMCTAPQNLWLPADGVLDGGRRVPAEVVAARLCAKVDALVGDPERAAGLCGALHSARTVDELARVREQAVAAGHAVLREPAPYTHPEFPAARTATPLIVQLPASDRSLAQAERFGPIAFVITAADRDAALAGATEDAARFGAIGSYLYSVDRAWSARAEEAFLDAGASVGVNLVRQRPMNFTAAFSDFHVTGLNPAGNASLTDPGFVSQRFRVVQVKRERPA